MMRTQLARVAEGLTGALEELRELSRGIHPGDPVRGLPPALKVLARRSAIPVERKVDVPRRLPSRSRWRLYYAYCVVSEALANAAKHAHASVAQVTAQAEV
jgi:signal transduction histidine kinase